VYYKGQGQAVTSYNRRIVVNGGITPSYLGEFGVGEVEEKWEALDSDRDVCFSGRTDFVKGPSVFVIGHIPYSEGIPAQSAYRRFFLLRPAFWLLFRTGNREPENVLCTTSMAGCRCGKSTLAQFFNENPPDRPEFRTVCWLHGITLEPRADGRARLKFGRGYRIGKTPSPSHPGSWARRYFEGYGEDSYEDPKWDSDGVTLVYKHTFKLGRLADFLTAVLTRSFAPSALIQIEYKLKTDGSFRIELGGSGIPTRTFYIDCDNRERWDMLDADEQEIRMFVRAGMCRTAPEIVKKGQYLAP
jgi:hypothetical protein